MESDITDSDFIAQNFLIGNFKSYGRKPSWPTLRYECGICPKGLSKTRKNFNLYSQCPAKNWATPKCE
jgi:hypothetical protein